METWVELPLAVQAEGARKTRRLAVQNEFRSGMSWRCVGLAKLRGSEVRKGPRRSKDKMVPGAAQALGQMGAHGV